MGTSPQPDVTTTWGRLILLGLVGYSVVVFSYLVGAVASLWVERDLLRKGEGEGNTEQPPTTERV